MKKFSARDKPPLEEDLSVHILSVSAAMGGVCLTVTGLIRIVITMGKFNTIADNLLAAASLVFLIACVCSYWALRTRGVRRMHRLERIADASSFGAPSHGRRMRDYYLRHDLIALPCEEVFEQCQLINRSRRRPRPRSPKTNEKIEDEDDDENELARTDNSPTLPPGDGDLSLSLIQFGRGI